MQKALTLALMVGLLGLGISGTANAVCNQSSVSTADNNLWNTHGCWQDFFLWSYKAYDQRQSDWQARGWNDACNRNLEFPKHWNAAYLVTYGLADANCCSWHGTTDYRKLAEAASSVFHGSLYHTARDDGCCFGSFTPKVFGPNELATHCITVAPENLPKIETSVAKAGVKLRHLGRTGGNRLTLPSEDPILVSSLQARHESWLPEFMGKPA
jgi:hypothetical protein